MFTGIIETTGIIRDLAQSDRSLCLGIEPDLRQFDVTPGDSISVDGICLTVEQVSGHSISMRAVEETLKHTTLRHIRVGDRVNLERALRVDGRINGNFVLGHVDGTGRILKDQKAGDSLIRTVEIPADLMPFMAKKGSVAIDGVSLTIADTGTGDITVSLIPFSLEHTVMALQKPGDAVNIECDVLARYIAHFLTAKGPAPEPVAPNDRAGTLYDKMQRLGF